MKNFKEYSKFQESKREDDEYHNGPDPVKHTYTYTVSKDGGEKRSHTVTSPLTRASKRDVEPIARKRLQSQGFTIHEPNKAFLDTANKGVSESANDHYAEAEDHLSKANDAEAEGNMKSFHAHMANHHDAMSEWHDSKGRSASADKHADKAEYHHEKSLTVKEEVDLNEAGIPKNHTIEAHGIRGMKGTPWRKTFKSHEHLSDWADKNDSVKVHATRDLDGVKKKTNEENINELSSDLLQRYKEKAKKSADELTAKGEHGKSLNRTMSRMKANGKQIEKTTADIKKSLNREEIDKGEYDYEGQMARTQLQTTMRNCRDLIDMIEDDENMPEWVQSKITLAQDYITTVRDYMQSKEELGEGVKSPGVGWMIKQDPKLKAVIDKHKQKMKEFKAYVGTKIEPKDKK
jgi:hypothetical protein